MPMEITMIIDHSLKGKTVVVTAGDRNLGKALSLGFAARGANVAIITHQDLISATSQLVSDEINAAGGCSYTFDINISDVNQIEGAIGNIIKRLSSIDILINNLSTFNFKQSHDTTPEEFDKVITSNIRATFFISKACIPHLKSAPNPHIINIAPPLDTNVAIDACKNHLLFSISKYGMTFCTIGMAQEHKQLGIAVNSLWPATPIATSTLQNNFQAEIYNRSRWCDIMVDAAYLIAIKPAKEFTGQFCIDENLLRESGVTNFTQYAVNPSADLIKDIFLPGADYNFLKKCNL